MSGSVQEHIQMPLGLKRSVTYQTQFSVKKDLLQCQKRPIAVKRSVTYQTQFGGVEVTELSTNKQLSLSVRISELC